MPTVRAARNERATPTSERWSNATAAETSTSCTAIGNRARGVDPGATVTRPTSPCTVNSVADPLNPHTPPRSAVPHPLAEVRVNVSVPKTTGPVGAVTVTDAVLVAVPPRLSVTVSPIVYVPSAGNVYDDVTPDPVPLGPNVHAYPVIDPSGSLDPDAFTLTVRPSTPTDEVNAAVGSTFGAAKLPVLASDAVAPSSSVTVRVTVWSPAVVKTWCAVGPVAVVPSSNVQAYPVIVPSGSLDAAASTSAVRFVTVSENAATGGLFGLAPVPSWKCWATCPAVSASE